MWTVNFQMFKLVLEKAEEPRCGLSSWLADGRLLAMSSPHGFSLVCVHGKRQAKERERSGVSYKDASPNGLGPHPSDPI